MMRLRKIWAEGSFSVLKREHCLSKVRKRGIPAVTEECLLSVMALNLKRMVKAILFTSYMLKIRAEYINFQPRFLFCQQVQLLTLPNEGFFHTALSAAVTFDDGGLKGDPFEFRHLQSDIPGSSSEVAAVVLLR